MPQFKIGDFVRIKGGNKTGRVTEVAENEDYPIPYTVCVFGDTNTERDFAPFHLEMWTPLTASDQFRERLEIDRLPKLVTRQLGSLELIGELVKAAINADPKADHENLLNNVELIADMSADATCEAVEMLWSMLEKQPDEKLLRDRLLAAGDVDSEDEPEPDSDEDSSSLPAPTNTGPNFGAGSFFRGDRNDYRFAITAGS